jgi:hypothetical protein
MPNPNNRLDFEKSTKERGALFLGCFLLGLGCWWLLSNIEPLFFGQSDPPLRVARFIFHDLMTSCITLCALICFWACFRPRWMEQRLERASCHIRFAFCLVVAFLFVFCPLVTVLIEHFRWDRGLTIRGSRADCAFGSAVAVDRYGGAAQLLSLIWPQA